MKIIYGCSVEGGGKNGAFTAGKIIKRDKSYKYGSGVSTGALMIILVLIKFYKSLEEAYLSYETKDLIENSAFNKKEKFNFFKLIKSQIIGRVTIGTSNGLKMVIKKYITQGVYNQLKASKKSAIVSAYSITYDEIVHFCTDKYNRLDFCDWIWSSANAAPLMSVLNKSRNGKSDNEEFVDGGIKDGQTTSELLSFIDRKHGSERLNGKASYEVDLFLHTHRPKRYRRGKTKNIVHLLIRYIVSLWNSNKIQDLEKAINSAKMYNAKLIVHWMPDEITGNSFIFKKDRMKEMYDLGIQKAFDNSLIDVHDFTKNKK